METKLRVPTGNRIPLIKLSYSSKLMAADRPYISKSTEAYQLLLANWDMDKIQLQEQVKLLLIDHANRAMGLIEISTGGITSSVVDIRLIFAAVFKARATSIMLAHNHPSGGTNPSNGDNKITQKLSEAARILDIRFLDHLIITPDCFYSYADEGML